MNIEAMPTLIDQFRETFEGEVTPGMCWITDGTPQSAVFGAIDALSPQQAMASPTAGAKSIAAHVAHLHFALALTARRLRGENPPADWSSSFSLADVSPNGWESLKRDLRVAYDAVLAILQENRGKLVQDIPPINLVGLAATIAHNAYHLGAIRQIAQVVREQR
ncbi:MAG: DinB family protein [Planctomycetota bacterium]|nr:DinB family protein [Planctomycetota bacterium]